MKYERDHDWRAVIRSIDADNEKKLSDYIAHVVQTPSSLERKHKELFLMAVSAALRYGVSTRVHGSHALTHGATPRELVEVLSLVSIQAGFTCFVDAVEALGDVLQPTGQAAD